MKTLEDEDAAELGLSLNGTAPEPPEPEENTERWVSIPIEDIENYEVSGLGHIRNKKGMLLTPYQPGKSSSALWVTLNSRAYRLDRLVLESFVGPPRSWRYGPRHLNGDQKDCSLGNLEWEYGLGRKPAAVNPQKPKAAKKTVAKPTPSGVTDVQERVFLESGNITVMWNRTERKVDISQLPNSSPIIGEADLPSLIKCLQHIVAS